MLLTSVGLTHGPLRYTVVRNFKGGLLTPGIRLLVRKVAARHHAAGDVLAVAWNLADEAIDPARVAGSLGPFAARIV